MCRRYGYRGIQCKSLINVVVNYSCMDRYLQQPIKCVILEIPQKSKRKNKSEGPLVLENQTSTVVQVAMHVGIF